MGQQRGPWASQGTAASSYMPVITLVSDSTDWSYKEVTMTLEDCWQITSVLASSHKSCSFLYAEK